MEISAIAAATIAILSPYMTKAGEEVAKKAANAAWEKASEIHQAVKAKFLSNNVKSSRQLMEQYEKDPKENKSKMEAALAEVLESDPKFTEKLLELLKQAHEAGAGAVFNVTVAGGEVGEIISIDKLEGGLRIDKRSGE